ncbi:MAG: hypothetical protein PHP30_06095 [Bacteroidales bacterium]|nr:hypothetical protein [Bacteroidales bacterium]
MKSLLMSFNQWYNLRKGMRGQVFNSPFGSCPIYSTDYLEYNFLYILTNPVRAGICMSIRDYRWSSYHFTKAGYYNFLSKIIDVDNLVVDFLFTSNKNLNERALKHIEEYWTMKRDQKIEVDNEGEENNGSNVFKQNKENMETEAVMNLDKPTDNEVAKYLKFVLQGRDLDCLSRGELVRILKILRFQGNASYRQISSVTHESFNDIVRMLKG